MKISIKKISFIIILSFITGGIITAFMERNSWLYGWFITSLLLGASFTVLYFLWKKAGSAKLLGWMIAVAFFLRLGLGVGLMKALPVIGYDTEQQKAGYVFFDAYRRDFQAMDIALSNKPILSVFSKQYATDQYGGYPGFECLHLSRPFKRRLQAAPDAHLLRAGICDWGALSVEGIKADRGRQMAEVRRLVVRTVPAGSINGCFANARALPDHTGNDCILGCAGVAA